MEGGLTFRMQVVRQSPSCFYTLRIKKKIPAGCHFLNVDKSTALDKNLNEGIKPLQQVALALGRQNFKHKQMLTLIFLTANYICLICKLLVVGWLCISSLATLQVSTQARLEQQLI